MEDREKPIEFLGSSLKDLKAFPDDARQNAGYQLAKVQIGRNPDDWKPMAGLGHGVREIRIREPAGAYRVLYVANFGDAIYVLHCFHKKTAKTSKRDLDLAKDRYLGLIKERGHGE